jgi:hypothetical protein
VARAGHYVHGGDAASPRTVDGTVPNVNGVKAAHARVQRDRSVAALDAPDVGMGVDEARHDDLTGDIVLNRTTRHVDCPFSSNSLDDTVLHDEDTVLDG